MLYSQFRQDMHTLLAEQGSRIVVAFSGGVDSCVLLHLLSRFKLESPTATDDQFIAVHIHHGLSEYADQWLVTSQQFAHRCNIPFYAEKVQLILGNRISIEQAARDARYQALAKHMNDKSILLTGQHSSDQLETFLLALKRGSGPKGLSSMAVLSDFSIANDLDLKKNDLDSKANGKIARPLLNVTQQSILDYAHQHNLSWVEDESNQDTRFDRNFIRRDIAPLLRERWPQIEKTVARSAVLCAEQETLLHELLFERYQAMLNDNPISHTQSLPIAELEQQSVSARHALIRMWIGQQGFLLPSAKQLDAIWNTVAIAKVDADPLFRYGNVQLGRSDQQLFVFSVLKSITDIQLTLAVDDPLMLPDNLGSLLLSSKRLADTEQGLSKVGSPPPLSLRLPCDIKQVTVSFDPTGITAHPEKRTHSRKLTKLFQEYKIPTWQRQRMPILIFNDKLLAVANLFVNRTVVVNNTESYYLYWYPAQ